MATAGSSPRRASERHRRRVLHRDGDDPLQDVLSSANATGLHRDLAAVQTALDLPWTTNPAEGQINRLKMITRTMYGRAGFALLRAHPRHSLRRTRGGVSPHPSADAANERHGGTLQRPDRQRGAGHHHLVAPRSRAATARFQRRLKRPPPARARWQDTRPGRRRTPQGPSQARLRHARSSRWTRRHRPWHAKSLKPPKTSRNRKASLRGLSEGRGRGG